mgnify:CR=1 FL=1
MSVLVSVREVGKRFRIPGAYPWSPVREVDAVRGVSFEVQAGSIVTILGSNGAGKTTVLKTVSGVMDPQKGTVLFEGREIQRMDPDKVMRLGISHVPEGREVFPLLTVRHNLMMGAYTRSDRDAVARDRPAARPNDAQVGSSTGSSEPSGQELAYSARVSLDKPEMKIDDNVVNLTPGMAVTVEITTGSRTVISYLLSPVARYVHDSLRER